MAWTTIAENLEPRKRQTIEEWVPENRRYENSSGWPGPRNLDVTPYIRPIHGWFDNFSGFKGPWSRLARYEICTLVTATQMSKTEGILDCMGARLAVKPRPQLFVAPDQNFARDIMEPRLTRMAEESASLQYDELASKKILKRINGVTVRFAWAGSAASMASDQAGDVFIDEYDKMFQTQRKQGDPFLLAEARSDTYADRKRLVTSTPLLGDVKYAIDERSGLQFWTVVEAASDEDLAIKLPSHIWRRWQSGTRHHLAWKCPHCGKWFIPRFDLLKYPPKAKAGEARRYTTLQPPCCQVDIEERHKESMNANFRIVAPGEWLDENDVLCGEPDEDTTNFSLWVSGLASPFVSWGDRVATWVSAKQLGEIESLQGARNNCGEVFSPTVVSSVGDEELLRKCLNYGLRQVPPEVLRVTMGVDVQGNRLVCVVRGWGSRSRSYLLEAFELWGPTASPEVWGQLGRVFDRVYGGMRIEKACIDTGFRPDKRAAGDYHKVLDFCKRFDWVCHATRGKAKQDVPVKSRREEVQAEGKADKWGLDVLSIDTDYFKSRWFSQLLTAPQEAMSAHFPSDYANPSEKLKPFVENYMKQIVSELRGEDGKWYQIHPQNHFLDAEVLAGVAAFMLKCQEIPDGSYRRNDDSEIVYPDEQSQPVKQQSFAESMAEMSKRFNKKR